MKKRIFILTLALLFLVSTTGLPFTYHLCKMMQEKSLSECEMCSSVMEEVVTNCCDEETSEYPVSISSDNPVCCQSEFIYNKVEDQFVNNESEINFYTTFVNLFQPVTLINTQSEFYPDESFYSDSSPPFLIDPEQHITNSVLLI
jgi:hypothetical protein